MKSAATDSWLIIGYGNTLREDDGAGPAVAEQLADLDAPGMTAIACAQLSPEHAEAVSQADQVIFVDASAEGGTGIAWRPVVPADSPVLDGHTLTPATLLALARQVYGRAPHAYVVTIPARQLGFGESLSAEAQAGVDDAFREILLSTGLAASLRLLP